MQRKHPDDKIRTATFRKDRDSSNPDAANVLSELPQPPFALDVVALDIYIQDGRNLIAAGILKATDCRLLAAYASEMAAYIGLMEQVNQSGLIIELPNLISTSSAQRKAAESALKNALQIADKLGISPIGRARLGLKSNGADPGKPDPLAFLFQN